MMRRHFLFLKAALLVFLLISRGTNLFGIDDLLDDSAIARGVFYVVIYLLTIEIVRSIIIKLYRRRKKMSSQETDNFILGISNLYILLYTFGLFFLLLSITNVQLTSFIFSVSIVAAALAILTKEFLTDILSSMLMTFSRELEVGDVVKMGEHKGKIVNMTLNKTTILTDEDDLVFFPNTKVFFSDIVNYTKRDIKKTSISFEMNNGIAESVTEIEDMLKEALEEYKDLIRPDSYNLRILDIKKDFVNFKFQYVLYNPNLELERKIRKKVVRTIFSMVNKQKIVQVKAGGESPGA